MKRGTALLLALLLCVACRGGEGRKLRVGSKNFSESVLLGEIVAQALESHVAPVDRRLNLGGTFVCHQAIVAGELDLYPEYTGTAFTAILRQKPISDAPEVRRRVAQEYEKRWGLEWSAPLGFENTFALVMRAEAARRLGIRKISDLSTHPDLRLGFGYEFVEREDGYKGLARIYDLHFRQPPAEMDLGLLYPALSSGKVDVAAGNSTDGLIEAIGGVVLEDDRHYFPPYEAAYVVRGLTWRGSSVVRETLERLAGSLSAEKMRRLNARIDRDKLRPEDVAREFLASLGR
jgi:glycine betaine/choline ABC-type transport system substrate-binding protein